MKTEVLFLNHFMCMRCFSDMRRVRSQRRRVRSRLYGGNAIFSMSKDKFQDKYRIDSARAKWHDYDDGFYFVTICTKNREYFFGTIQNCEMILSPIGTYVKQQLQIINERYLYAEIMLWTIMPNHIHLILSIDSSKIPHKKRDIPVVGNDIIPKTGDVSGHGGDVSGHVSTAIECAVQGQSWLSNVICQFKQSIKRFANQHKIEFAWQTRFHDHIIRNQKEMDLISEYIENNVRKWKEDCFYC